MTAQVVHHFPPELFDLLVDAIPRLLKGKQNVLDFFKSCGVPGADYSLLQRQVLNEKTGGPKISKFEIARQVLRTLNDLGDARLRERREVVRRVAQWDDFTRSYENDRAAAEGFVARIQKLVNTKDSFTRMNETAERAQAEARREREQKATEAKRARDERLKLRDRIAALYGLNDPHSRGRALEAVLNELFKNAGISIRESFHVRGGSDEGVLEQIDGAIGLDGEVYLVEMKWWAAPLGPDATAQHVVRVYSRGDVRGIFISSSGFTDAAVTQTKEALVQKVLVLIELQEILALLAGDQSLSEFLIRKVQAAMLDKNPLLKLGTPDGP